MTDREQSVEQRFSGALADETASASELAALVGECEAAIDAVLLEKKDTYDVTRWPDVEEALTRRDDCEFRRDRLRTLLMQLERRREEAAAAEYHSKWHSDAEALEGRRDQLAAEWGQVYPAAVGHLISLITRTAALDEEISTLHRRRPAGVSRHLLNPELVARGLNEFNRYTPSIAKELRLPDWANSAQTVWPPRQQRDLSIFTPSFNPRFSADWASMAAASARRSAR